MPSKFYIGATEWPGLSKLIEEAGEVCQVAGKIIATDGKEIHWDGTNLRERLLAEMADLSAAIMFVLVNNNFDYIKWAEKRHIKLTIFETWHERRKLGDDAT